MRSHSSTIDERLLTFEIGGSLFAMPIAGVLEVTEPTGTARIPTVPEDVASGGYANTVLITHSPTEFCLGGCVSPFKIAWGTPSQARRTL